MSCDRLYCLTLGHERSPRWISLEGGGDAVLRLPVIGMLVRSVAGGWWLLETGLNPDFCADPAQYGRIYGADAPELPGAGDPLLDALENCGVSVDELAGVAVSHLHVDHAGGLRWFADGRVPVCVQRREHEFALGGRAGEAEAYWRPDYEQDGLQWRLLDGDAKIAPGIDAVSTPGHTPGHMSYRVRMAGSGDWLFAVDAIDLQEGIDTGIPIGASADPADAPKRLESHRRLVEMARATGARLVPGHCPVTWPTLLAPPASYT